ncbi:MAG: ArsR family transcriptional regulator [Armatimonadetes bacterium]|nr:ArsR family transcriptional regulator [Armatimonadota bacterium]
MSNIGPVVKSALFGSTRRTGALLALQLLESSYATELALVLRVPLSSMQLTLDRLEMDGLLVSGPVGRERVYSWNVRYPLLRELRALLAAMIWKEPDLETSVERRRRRPRKRGKPL